MEHKDVLKAHEQYQKAHKAAMEAADKLILMDDCDPQYESLKEDCEVLLQVRNLAHETLILTQTEYNKEIYKDV